jgi:ABC-type sugar transport system ATPase subunit
LTGSAKRGSSTTQNAAADRDIAMVFQNYALYPHMSSWCSYGCGKNMAFGLRRYLDRRQVINELAPMDRDIAMVFQNRDQ